MQIRSSGDQRCGRSMHIHLSDELAAEAQLVSMLVS
jgi:hypothetical protein